MTDRPAGLYTNPTTGRSGATAFECAPDLPPLPFETVMYAVIRTGGKQYRVAANQVVEVEKLDAAPGTTIAFDEVLMVGDGDNATVGTPLVAGASVSATVLDQTRGEKVIVFKKRRRKNYRRRNGHRQYLTMVRVTDITLA